MLQSFLYTRFTFVLVTDLYGIYLVKPYTQNKQYHHAK